MEHVLNCTGYEMLMKDAVKGEGYYIYNEAGQRYMDFEAGVWSISLGHGCEEINTAIKNQLNKIMHLGFRYTNPVVEAAAKNVIQTLEPFQGKCVFLCSGSEAVELAVKGAKHIIKDKMLLTFNLSYLSAYGKSGSKEDHEWYKLDLLKCMECKTQSACETCSVLKEVPFDRIGAFVFEPGNTSGLVLLPPKTLIQEIEKRVKAHNGLILVDEVTTGVGRTGKWYGFQHYAMKPDIVAIGKGIGNGYPVSVVAFEERIADQLQKEGFKHSQSHQNDALGCATISSVISIIQEKQLIQNSNEKGQYLLNALEKMAADYQMIKEVRGIGLMLALEFKEEAAAQLKSIVETLFQKGMIVGYNPRFHLMRFYPTLTTTREDMDALLQCLRETLDTVGL